MLRSTVELKRLVVVRRGSGVVAKGSMGLQTGEARRETQMKQAQK
jgi:hypothetical protein